MYIYMYVYIYTHTHKIHKITQKIQFTSEPSWSSRKCVLAN